MKKTTKIRHRYMYDIAPFFYLNDLRRGNHLTLIEAINVC